MRKAALGRKRTPEAIEKQRKKLTGRTLSENHKKHISEKLKGKKNNANWTEEDRKKQSGRLKGKIPVNVFEKGHKPWNIGRPMSNETKEKLRKIRKGTKLTKKQIEKIRAGLRLSKCWKGGKSFEPYCSEFTKSLKKEIRDTFDNLCFIGGTNCKNCKPIHHIDYNKNAICNGKKWALIPLCWSHHTRTNYDRWYWFNLLINYWAFKYTGEEPYVYSFK